MLYLFLQVLFLLLQLLFLLLQYYYYFVLTQFLQPEYKLPQSNKTRLSACEPMRCVSSKAAKARHAYLGSDNCEYFMLWHGISPPPQDLGQKLMLLCLILLVIAC